MNKIARFAYSQKHIRRMKLFERQFLRPVYDALQDQIKPVVAKLNERGVDAAISSIDAIVLNEHITPVLLDIYEVVGLYQGRKTLHEVKQSTYEKKDAGFGVDEQLLRLITTYLTQNILQTVIDITDTSKAQILSVLLKGQQNGWGVDRIAMELMSQELTLWRARLIVRTETAKANNYGFTAAENVSEWEMEKTWIAANDHRTRHSHRVVDDDVRDAGQRFRVPIYKVMGGDKANGIKGIEVEVGADLMSGPGDSTASAGNICNCFPGDTLVEGQFIGGQRLKYSGEVIEIVTRSGKRLTVTPNHPIFTEKGMIAASLINKGDYVFSNIKKSNGAFGLVNDYIKKEPVLAANLFRSLDVLFKSEQMMVSGLDFDGDGVNGNGYIDIVNINRELQFNSKSLPEDIGKFSFKSTELEQRFVFCISSLNQLSMAALDTGSDGMTGGDLSFPLGFGHSRPFQYFSIGTSTNWNASRFESASDDSAGISGFIRKLLHGNSGVIFRDEIVDVRYNKFVGHLYDFSTLSGAILANNIYIKNCRCTIALRAKRDERGRLIRKRNISVLLPQDINRTRTIVTI